MAVSIHVSALKLVNVNNLGQVVDKDAASTTLEDIKNAASKEIRVIPNGTGSAESTHSGGHPTLASYLAAEANDDHALAHLDQTWVITQQIT